MRVALRTRATLDLFSSALAVMACLSLAACQLVPANPAAVLQASLLESSRGMGASQSSVYLDREGRLGVVVASLREGLFSLSENGERASIAAGRYEQLAAIDYRPGQHWLASFNLDSRVVEVFERDYNSHERDHKSHTVSLRHRVPTSGIAGDSLCFFASRQNAALYLFIQDGRGRAQQWLVHHPAQPLTEPRLLRTLNQPDNINACAVDSQRGWLYVAEANTGIWRYQAEPEATLNRHLVAAGASFGDLDKEITGITVDGDGSLWAVRSGESRLYHLVLKDGRFKSPLLNNTSVQLPTGAPASITAYRGGPETLTLAFYDTASDAIWIGRRQQSMLEGPAPIAVIPEVPAKIETPPASQTGDVMDDPAIWFNPRDPSQSRILGTNKRRGLHVYNLDGEQLQFLADGRLNNVDIRTGFSVGGRILDIAVATRRDDNSLVVYTIDERGVVKKLAQLPTVLSEIYGVCMAKLDNRFYAYANDKDGRVIQYLLHEDQKSGELAAKTVRTMKLASQPEGCVVDDAAGRLFVGEESRGVWVTAAGPDAPVQFTLVAAVGEYLQADVEGMAIARAQRHGKSANWLVVSSQGNDSYSVYRADPPFDYLGRFRIGFNLDAGVDGASDTDGLDVSSLNFGSAFPEGIMVVQDGRNLMPNEPQNYKLVDWRDIVDVVWGR